MLSEKLDTIVAIATPPGVGGIGIIRISGELALFIAQSMLPVRAHKLTPKQAVYADFLAADGKVLDTGIVIFFKSPHSFTGEDIVEFHGHGGPIILQILLSRMRFLGARLAEPGEFSKRAFLNGKIDLLQAEGIASLIHAQTEQAALAAAKTLQGAFSEKINYIVNCLIEIRMHLEAMINFPEDDIDNRDYDQLYHQTNNLKDQIVTLLAVAKQGKLLDNGIRALILGKPNVGKSSLLNRLLGEDRIIVTNIAGTTRDLVSYKVNLDGLVIDFADTAGMRLTDDLVEQIGIQKAIQEIKIADLIVLVKSAEDIDIKQLDSLELKDFLPVNITLELLTNKKIILLINKIDLYQSDPKVILKDNTAIILISTLYDQGIELFKQIVKQNLEFSSEALPFIAKERHIAALQQVHENILLSQQILIKDHTSLDLFAEELRLAQEGLSQITGAFSNEDLLNKIFAEFCIGK